MCARALSYLGALSRGAAIILRAGLTFQLAPLARGGPLFRRGCARPPFGEIEAGPGEAGIMQFFIAPAARAG